MNILRKHLFLFLVVVGVVFIGSGAKVHALSQMFPDPVITKRVSGCDAGSPPCPSNWPVSATVSRAGYNSIQNFSQQLEAPISVMKLYFRQPTGNSAVIESLCHEVWDSPGSQANFYVRHADGNENISGAQYFSANSDPNWLNSNVDPTTNGTYGSACSNGEYQINSIGTPSSPLTESTVPGRQGYYVAILYVSQTGQPGTMSFRVRANGPGSVATFFEINPSFRNDTRNPNNYGLDNASAMLDKYGNPGSKSEFGIDFAPDCAINGDQEDMYIKWFDGDYPGASNNNVNTRFDVYDLTTGGQLVGSVTGTSHWSISGLPGTDLGGNNVFGYLGIRVTKNHHYAWRWKNVDRNNGIQIWMPYSEINTAITCVPPDKPVDGDLQAAGCNLDYNGDGTLDDVSGFGWVQDPDRPDDQLTVEVFINNNDPANPGRWVNVDDINNTIKADVPWPAVGNHGFLVPRSRASKFFDVYGHQLIARVTGKLSDGSDNPADQKVMVKDMGVCAKPTCTVRTEPSAPEIEKPFSLVLSYFYTPGKFGRPFQPQGAVSFNSGPNSFHNFPAATTGATYTFGSSEFSPSTISVAGSYPANGSVNQAGVYGVICDGGAGANQQPVSRIPYFKIYGNDAMAGGVFGSGATCSGNPANSTATFRGYNKAGPLPSSDPNYGFYRGAGAQFGLYALGTVQEVPSLGMADVAIRALNNPRSQTFANWDMTASTYFSDYGGRSKLTRTCIPDYFNTSSGQSFQNMASITPQGDTSGGTTFTYINGNVKIKNQPNFSGRQTIFVNGNARLESNANIKYVPFTNSSNAPNFTLIVKGNIYIDNGTSQLDGTYIAQPATPSDATKGQIVTCYYADTGPVPAQYMANPPQPVNGGCNNKLTINGALIARQIKLLRTNGSMSNGMAPVSDPPNFSWSYFDVATDPNRHCITVREPSLPGSPTSGRQSVWYDNWLCARNGLGIEWVNNGAYGLGGLRTPEQPGYVYEPQRPNRNKTVTIGGVQKECVLFYEPSMLNTQTAWNDNWLCMNQSNDYDLKFYHGGPDNKPASNPGTCIAIWEPSDSWPASYQSPVDGSWQPPSPYSGTWQDNWLCVVNTYVTPSVPEASSPNDNIAEVLNFSPEVYLNPADYQPPTTSKKRYDSIQTLPPIF